jgi:hypothetical protein
MFSVLDEIGRHFLLVVVVVYSRNKINYERANFKALFGFSKHAKQIVVQKLSAFWVLQ